MCVKFLFFSTTSRGHYFLPFVFFLYITLLPWAFCPLSSLLTTLSPPLPLQPYEIFPLSFIPPPRIRLSSQRLNCGQLRAEGSIPPPSLIANYYDKHLITPLQHAPPPPPYPSLPCASQHWCDRSWHPAISLLTKHLVKRRPPGSESLIKQGANEYVVTGLQRGFVRNGQRFLRRRGVGCYDWRLQCRTNSCWITLNTHIQRLNKNTPLAPLQIPLDWYFNYPSFLPFENPRCAHRGSSRYLKILGRDHQSERALDQ